MSNLISLFFSLMAFSNNAYALIKPLITELHELNCFVKAGKCFMDDKGICVIYK